MLKDKMLDENKKKRTETSQPGSGTDSETTGQERSKGFATVIELSCKQEDKNKHAEAIANKLNIPVVDPLRAEPAALARLDPDIAFETQAVPVRLVNNRLLVAMATPEDESRIAILRLFTSCEIHPAAASPASVSRALQEFYAGPGKKRSGNIQAPALMGGGKGALSISVISNKGGVGKTHFSINLACALGQSGARVLLIDADLGNADVSNKLNIFPKLTLLDFLQKTKPMQEIVLPTDFHFDLICSKFGDFKLANLNYPQKIKFLKHFKNISPVYDFVIFDLGAGISRTVLDFALAADRTVIVTTLQDIISGYACAKASFFRHKEIEEKLETQLQDYRPQCRFAPMLISNQVNSVYDGQKLFSAIKKTADEKINISEDRFRIDFEYLGGVPYDRKSFVMAEKKKKPLLYEDPSCKVSRCFQNISKKLSTCNDKPSSPESKQRSAFRRFFGIFTQN